MPKDERILKRGDILNKKYKVEKFLGGGAFGEVYRVLHIRLKKRFAIKVFKISLDLKGSESTVQDLLDEAVILAKFDHRNIVKVIDADTFTTSERHEYVFFIMDYVSGGDLDDYWRSFGMNYMPVDEVINIVKQICTGLNVLHSENPPLIHRDIKPQNIMIGYDNHGIVAKLTDFGLVKTVNPSTLYASAKGTLAFKAPEYLEEIDNTSTDIFAVGVTFYQLLTDKLPYPINGELDVMTGNWLKQTPKPLKYHNPLIDDKKLEEIVFKSISTEPSERYQNAEELLNAIEEWEITKKEDAELKKINKVEIKPKITIKESHNKSSDYGSKEIIDSDFLEKFFNNQHKSAEELLNEAKKAVTDNFDYENGIKYLEQAFEHKPEYKEEYGSKLKLWKTFKLISDENTIDEGIDSLKLLMLEDSSIKSEYDFISNVLSTKNPIKLEAEALKYIKNYDTEKGCKIIEVAMMMDENIKNKYKYKLKNWKKGVIN